MRYLLLLLIPFSIITSHADENCVPSEGNELENSGIGEVAKSFVRKNCHSSMSFMTDKLATSDAETEICGSCRSEFLSKVEPFSKDDTKELKAARERAYLQTLYKELEKSVTATVLDVVSQRSLGETKSSYSQATKSCNTNDFIDRMKKCGGEKRLEATGIKITEFSDSLNKRVGELYTSRSSSDSQRKMCPMNENINGAQTAQLYALALEESFTPQVVEIIRNIDPNLSPREFDNQMTEKLGQYDSFNIELRYHPLLNTLKKDPKRFIALFKSLSPQSDHKAFTQSLREALYTAENGNLLDQELAQRCESAFKTFEDKVCGDKFSGENINLGRMENYERMLDNKTFHDEAAYASENPVKEDNYNLLSFCPGSNTGDKPYALDSDLSKINHWMDGGDKAIPLGQYVRTRLLQQIEIPHSGLCDDCSKSQETIGCRMQRILKGDSGASQGLLAKEYDPHVNNVLRSLLGTPTNITPEVREVLVSEGILPQSDGSYVAQENNKSQPTSPGGKTSATAAIGASNGAKQSAASQLADSSSQTQTQRDQSRTQRSQTAAFVPQTDSESSVSDFSSSFDEKMNQLSELSRAEEKRMQEIRDEITRRLGAKPETRPTREQVAQATQETLRRQNTRVSPARQTQMVDQLMREFSRSDNTNYASPGFGTPSGERVQLGDDLAGPSEESKRWNQALEDRLKGNSGSTTAATAAGGLSAGSSPGRSPAASSVDQENLNLPVVEINLRGGDLTSLESVLTEKLGNDFAENFKLEITSAQFQDPIQYQITMGENKQWKVIPLGNSPSERSYMERIEEVLNRLYQDRGRNARLRDLRNISF